MKTLFAMLAVLLLAGCGGGTNIKAQVAGANVEIARARAEALTKPLVEIRVPLQNCTEKDGSPCTINVTVRQPAGGGGAEYIPSPDDPWARVAERLVGGAVTAGGIYLGGAAAAEIVRAGSAGIVDALRTQPAPVIVPAAEPVAVMQPAPVVVTQPPPVIVEPVVVEQQVPVFGPQP